MSDADEAVKAIRARALARAARGRPAASVSRPGQSAVVIASMAEHTRTAVLDATESLLRRSGFAKVQLEDVALEAAVTRAQLNEICFSREELFFQVLVREVEQVVSELELLLAQEVPALELMRALSERGFSFVSEHPLLLQLLLGEAADAMPSWEERLDELRRRLLEIPMKLVELGMNQGILRRDLPADLIAGLLFEIHVAGYLLHHRPGPDAAFKAAQRRAAILEILANGLRDRT